jgi:Ca2+-binding RTX toxin-like protein
MSCSRRRAGGPALVIASVVALALGLATVAVAATFTGTSGPDQISATDENDTISTGRGNDTVFAGLGSDSVSLGAGADLADVSSPVEALFLNPDALEHCRNDDDTANGQGGSDNLRGGVNHDCQEFADAATVDHDTLNGSGGADTIDVKDAFGCCSEINTGSDVANGGRGNDTCYGDQNDQFISCEHVNP